ncbi:MAG: UDP-N-acetylglucosamine 2-epimerase [Candidatus Falkowbacteria bacterium]
MSKKFKKILVITGTRAEYGLLKSTIDEIIKSKKLELKLLATGIHTLKKYGLTLNEIKKDKIPISCIVKVSDHDDMLTSLAKEIAGINKYCLKEKPDLIVVLGDRDEPFAGAIVGGHLKIPVAHIHGGDVTGYVVDEYIRHSITKFSHLHFTATQKSYQRVLKLGEENWRVHNVGGPGIDNIKKRKKLDKKALGKKYGLDINKKWFLVVHHPTSLDQLSLIKQVNPLFDVLTERSDIKKIVILPNSDTGSKLFIKTINQFKAKKDFYIHPNLTRDDYLNFLANVDLLIGNSSSGILESGYFKLPTVNIGNRQKGRECGQNVIHVNCDKDGINKAVDLALSDKFKKACQKTKHPYGYGTAGKEIVKLIAKHIDNKDLFYKKFTYA